MEKGPVLQPEPVWRSRDNSQRLPDFDSCQLIFIFVAYITAGALSFSVVVKMRFDIGLHVVVYSNSNKAPPEFRYYLTRLSV